VEKPHIASKKEVSEEREGGKRALWNGWPGEKISFTTE